MWRRLPSANIPSGRAAVQIAAWRTGPERVPPCPPIPIGSQREFVRQVLSDERSLRADGARFVQQAQEPARSLEQRMYLNADGSPSEQVAAGYRWRAGTELQRAA